jgi:hypothetical protein
MLKAPEIVPVRQAESDLRPDAVGDSGLALAWHSGTRTAAPFSKGSVARAMRGSTSEGLANTS